MSEIRGREGLAGTGGEERGDSLLYDKEGYLFMETDMETLTISLLKNLKEKLKREGGREGISMQEVVLQILAERNWEE